MTDYTELRRLATAATPGPWTIHTEEVCSPIVAAMELSKLVHGSVFVPVLPMVVGSNGLATAVTGCGPTSVANAAYIAAISPDVVLTLLADLDALRTRLAEVERDALRLNWIQRHLFGHKWNGVIDSGSQTRWDIWSGYRHITATMIGNTFSEAIDAAIGVQA